MARRKTHTDTIKAVDEAYKAGNRKVTDRLEEILLPKNTKLPKDLQEILESFGDTPIEEREAKIMKTTLSELAEEALGDNVDDFVAVDVSNFCAKLVDRIQNFKDDKGFYKTTKLLDKFEMPKTKMINEFKKDITESFEELKEIQSQLDTLIENEEDGYLDKLEELSKKGEKINENTRKKRLKKLGFKKDELSEWEDDLLNEMILGFIMATSSNSIKNPADFTPFAGYLVK